MSSRSSVFRCHHSLLRGSSHALDSSRYPEGVGRFASVAPVASSERATASSQIAFWLCYVGSVCQDRAGGRGKSTSPALRVRWLGREVDVMSMRRYIVGKNCRVTYHGCLSGLRSSEQKLKDKSESNLEVGNSGICEKALVHSDVLGLLPIFNRSCSVLDSLSCHNKTFVLCTRPWSRTTPPSFHFPLIAHLS